VWGAESALWLVHRYIFAGFLPGLLSGLASLAQSEATVKALSKLIISDSGRESLRWSLCTFVVHFENGGAHLPAEEAGMPTMYLLLLVALLLFVPVYWKLVRVHVAENPAMMSLRTIARCEMSGVCSVILWVGVVLTSQLAAVALELCEGDSQSCAIHLLAPQLPPAAPPCHHPPYIVVLGAWRMGGESRRRRRR
jgi:hypothetical protein